MDSELVLHSCLLALHPLGAGEATAAYASQNSSLGGTGGATSSFPELMNILIGSGSLGSIVGLLKHPNLDIQKVVIGLLTDMTSIENVFSSIRAGQEQEDVQDNEDARAVGKQ